MGDLNGAIAAPRFAASLRQFDEFLRTVCEAVTAGVAWAPADTEAATLSAWIQRRIVALVRCRDELVARCEAGEVSNDRAADALDRVRSAFAAEFENLPRHFRPS